MFNGASDEALSSLGAIGLTPPSSQGDVSSDESEEAVSDALHLAVVSSPEGNRNKIIQRFPKLAFDGTYR